MSALDKLNPQTEFERRLVEWLKDLDDGLSRIRPQLTPYDDSLLTARVERLERTPPKGYDDSELRLRVDYLEGQNIQLMRILQHLVQTAADREDIDKALEKWAQRA